MVHVALIKKNRCNFNDIGKHAMDILYRPHAPEVSKKIRQNIDDYIWSVMEDYIEFVDIPICDIMEYACRAITSDYPDKQIDRDFMYYTEQSYSFPKLFIEFIHCLPAWKSYQLSQEENMNNICSLLSIKQHVIEGSIVALASTYDITTKEKIQVISITKEDIIRCIRRRFFFTSVLIGDNTMQKYYYQDRSILVSQVFKLNGDENIEHIKFNLLGYNLIMYFKMDKSKYVNTIATRINGLYRVYGDVLLLHELEENVNANLSIHEAKRLNVLSYGRLYDREMMPNEIEVVEQDYVDSDGKHQVVKTTPLRSRYAVVDKRMKYWQQHKNICINCGGNMVKPVICDSCYRIKYCSVTCKDEYYSKYHSDECIKR